MLALGLLAAAALRPEPAAFERLAGRCWVGVLPNGKRDTHCFEPMYGGRLLRDRHEVASQPPYRGETIYHWNARKQRVEWTYWNSFGDAQRGHLFGEAHRISFYIDNDDGKAGFLQWTFVPAGGYLVDNGRLPMIRFVRAKR